MYALLSFVKNEKQLCIRINFLFKSFKIKFLMISVRMEEMFWNNEKNIIIYSIQTSFVIVWFWFSNEMTTFKPIILEIFDWARN